jgi:23S rRNA pseudouridine1911/1915/1917 synthase
MRVEVTVGRADARRRLDLVVHRLLTGPNRTTRTRVQSFIRSGAVQVDGLDVRRPATRTSAGEVITVSLPERGLREASPVHNAADCDTDLGSADVTLDVIYEDEHFLVVNKPAGVVVHPTYRHPTGTLLHALRRHARHWPSRSRPSLVGRLDKATSGVVLVAKTRPVHAALQRTLAGAVSAKDYLTVVYGRVPARGAIAIPLARDPLDRRRVAPAASGRSSLTRFERLARVGTGRAALALVRCRLVTGRMHQIRVHLAARGWPIVGDPVYGEPRWSHVTDSELYVALQQFPRQALHAWRLTFPHPISGARLTCTAPLPADMTALVRACRFRIDFLPEWPLEV